MTLNGPEGSTSAKLMVCGSESQQEDFAESEVHELWDMLGKERDNHEVAVLERELRVFDGFIFPLQLEGWLVLASRYTSNWITPSKGG